MATENTIDKLMRTPFCLSPPRGDGADCRLPSLSGGRTADSIPKLQSRGGNRQQEFNRDGDTVAGGRAEFPAR